ncbi:MAG TPA: hypothetical protein VHB47_18805 [Thermoanaerobaculia bacterium]|jgi:hypothetical protein|nr:hypothetical protein [Thermoanaerobaculia bacterium]
MAGSTISLQISAAHAQDLERRGGRSHRGRGTFSRSVSRAVSLLPIAR